MRRNLLKTSHVFGVGVLTAALVSAAFLTHPAPAFAAGTQQAVQRVVTFDSDGTTTEVATTAATVGAFLEERGVVVNPGDYLQPAASTPLSDRLIVDYTAAVPVTIAMRSGSKKIVSASDDVGALLEEQDIVLGPHDIVKPSLSDRLSPGQTVRIVRVAVWTKTRHQAIAPATVHRIVFTMKPGTTKVLAKGRPGLRETLVRYTQRDGGRVRKTVLASSLRRKPAPRIVAEGAGEYAAFEHMARRGLAKTSFIAASALRMVATAYTANCAGCDGVTAMGYRAGHGVVAVDPHYIPLGSRLYIPGYGYAIAGDTGGAIRGNRIDLGFNSVADAIEFGRREITVYRLK